MDDVEELKREIERRDYIIWQLREEIKRLNREKVTRNFRVDI